MPDFITLILKFGEEHEPIRLFPFCRDHPDQRFIQFQEYLIGEIHKTFGVPQSMIR